MPLGRDYAGQSCALARALEILGERWTLLIVRDAFHGLTRYDEFLSSLGLATNMLSTRLQKLVEHGVLERAGSRGSYHLTQKGRDLFPVILTLMAWADCYEPGPDGPEVLIQHMSCGHEAGGSLQCEHCGDPITLSDLQVMPAPSDTTGRRRHLRRHSSLRGAVGRPSSACTMQVASESCRSARSWGTSTA